MSKPVLESLRGRASLTDRYGENALLLYALEMRFGIDDILTEAASCLTDGPNDRKCDAIYIDRDTGCAVIAQGYVAAKPKTEAPANKASDLNTAVAWVLGGAASEMNESLRAAAEDLNMAIEAAEIERIELWYCHNLPESANVQLELDAAARSAIGQLAMHHPDLDISVGAIEVGLERLSEWYASIQNPILVADELEVEVDGWFEEVGTDWTAVCASVPALWLTDLHSAYGDRLFSANVRGYMPSRRTAQNINYNIEKTARERPGHFWAFNNGVTALVNDYATPALGDGRTRLKLSGIAVVNGAQTTGALSRSASSALEDAAVLTRFVKCDDPNIVDDLIRFNNSQNPIKPSDFRSTDRHQERLRQQFEAIPDSTYLGARRGGQADRARRPSNLVPSDTAAQALAAFHGDPGTAYHSLRSIWERDEIYAKYFSDFTTAPHVVFVYALLGAVQEVKIELTRREKEDSSGLAQDELDTLHFFRQRGAQFLLAAAIGHCIEILMGRPVPSAFALSFGTHVSPASALEIWMPVVDAVVPFCEMLQAEELRGSLRNSSRVDEAIAQFRAMVRSAARGGSVTFSQFAEAIVISDNPAARPKG